MKVSTDRILLFLLIGFILVFTVIQSSRNQRSLRYVEKQLDSLNHKMEYMSSITGHVIESMNQNLVLLAGLSVTVEQSGKMLSDILKETRNITSEERKKITTAVSDLEKAKVFLEEEKRKASRLLGEINRIENE